MVFSLNRHRWAVIGAFLPLFIVTMLAQGADPPPNPHIPGGRRIRFNHTKADGAGFRWDLYSAGGVLRGTAAVYNYGMQFSIDGRGFSAGRYGWGNAKGDEVEVGAYTLKNLRVYRRIRVYKDRGLARWMEILQNPTGKDITVTAKCLSRTSVPIRNIVTSSGAKTLDERDTAFITQCDAGKPALLHILRGRWSSVRPAIKAGATEISVSWKLTVPARKTVILCYFESQSHSMESHKKLMKTFDISAVLEDLSPQVRNMIVNWSGQPGDITLDRNKSSDSITLIGGDRKFGTITNKSFEVETHFGAVKLQADALLGMMALPDGTQMVRFALKDGQIICATTPAHKIKLSLPTGGTLQIPISRIRQWSYRISPQRPAEIPTSPVAAILRTGDRLFIDRKSLNLTFLTRYGRIKLDSETILKITMDNSNHAIHRVFFRNGSHMGGFLEPEKIPLKFHFGPTKEISRNMVLFFRFATEKKIRPDLWHAVLTNEDELYGKLSDQQVKIASDFGTVSVKPDNIKKITISDTHTGWATLELWDTTTLRGRILCENLAFSIAPKTELKINPMQFTAINYPRVLPPDKMVLETKRLIALLGAESYKDRKKATDALILMGRPILPVLKKKILDPDPEVKQRLEEIIEKIEKGGK